MTRSFEPNLSAQHVWRPVYRAKDGQPVPFAEERPYAKEALELEVVALRLLYAQQRTRIAELEALLGETGGPISKTSPL